MIDDRRARTGPHELGLMYAHTCNIECRHCGILSGPKNRARMAPGMAERCIRQAGSIPGLDTVAFTGGEPFVFVADLDRLLGHAYDAGLSTRVVTNGFWARNVKRGREILRRLQLAGLDSLNFSADKFHLEFMEASVLRNAFAIARELGFPVIVNFVVDGPGNPAEEFSRLYGVPIEEIRMFANDDEFVAMVSDPEQADELHGKIHLHYGRLIGLGRAADYPEEHHLAPKSGFPRAACGEIVNRPVVYPNGDLQACCCAGGRIAEFTVGNVAHTPLDVLFEIMRSRTHFRFINAFGPRCLHDALSERRGDAGFDRPFASICDICVEATRGLPATEVDNVLEHWMVGRLLDGNPPDPSRRGRNAWTENRDSGHPLGPVAGRSSGPGKGGRR